MSPIPQGAIKAHTNMTIAARHLQTATEALDEIKGNPALQECKLECDQLLAELRVLAERVITVSRSTPRQLFEKADFGPA